MSRPKPPPRPDLEEQSIADEGSSYSQTTVSPCSNAPPKPSKKVPPPIPFRPDLGEGIEDNVHVPNPPVLKKPPPVMEKKARQSKSPARPKITIISAQPMTTPGIVSPPTLAPSVPSHPEPPPPTSPPTPHQAVDSSSTTASRFISPISPPTVAFPPPPVVHSTPATMSSTNKPMAIYPQPSSPSNTVDAVTPPFRAPSEPIISPLRPTPTVPSKNTSTFSPSSSGTGSPSPNRVNRTPKSRDPPQRPKSKPVCELPGEEEPIGSLGIMNTSIIDNQGESPIAPKRKKNKPDKSKASFPIDFNSGSGIDNSAFFESVKEDNNDVNQTPTSMKPKSLPTVIRTKPNGKDIHSTSVKQESFQQVDNSKTQEEPQTKTSKPTVIKPQNVKLKPPPTAKKALQKDENTEIPPQGTRPAGPAKLKSKPTLIIPKGRKDAGRKIEGTESEVEESKVVSPSNKQPILEIQNDSITDKKPSKTKKNPSIIRPNKLKKDTGSPKGDNIEVFRGTPEGESQENQTRKLGPVKRAPAPPRPGPPKPAPARPAPPRPGASRRPAPHEPKTSIESGNVSVKFEVHPKAPAPSETKIEQVQESYIPVGKKHKVKHPRPATIGKDKESEEHKNTEITKKKEEQQKQEVPGISSVVSTKIEPSAIALYDYIPTTMDDLSFKAGDEIFLVKRVDHEWYIGRCGDSEGMMPVQFVEIIEDLPPGQEEPTTTHKASNKTSVLLTTIALYNFDAQSSDELTLYEGDTVHLLEMVNEAWLKGQINGKSGIFPVSFVDFSEDMKHKLKQNKSTIPTTSRGNLRKERLVVSSGPRCNAIYDYDTGNKDDLRFNTGDVIRIVERINADWLKGEIHGSTGMFPAAYVEIIEDLEIKSDKIVSSPFPVTTALHDYNTHAEGDLSFRKGDRITIIEKISDDWLEGELNGQKGMLPSAYVEHVEMPGSTQHQKVPGHQLTPQDHLLSKGKALYDFTAEHDSELTFKAGDEIILLKQVNEEWMEGEFNNDIGQFPIAFIDILVPLP